MAASFESSSHRRNWLRGKREILNSNAEDIIATSADEIRRLRLYFVEIIHTLGRALRLRQRVIATAVVFFKRFYLIRSFGEFDPRVTAPTMLFVAAKVEETDCRAQKFLNAIKENQRLSALYKGTDLTIDKILHFEFEVLEALEFDLIVFHPYRPVCMILDEVKQNKMLQMAWSITNDSYRTDLCLEYSPAKIAIAVIYLSLVLQKCSQVDRERFLKLAGIGEEADVQLVLDIAGQLLELYRYYSKVGKGKGLPKDLPPSDAVALLKKLRDAHTSLKEGDKPGSVGMDKDEMVVKIENAKIASGGMEIERVVPVGGAGK